MKKQLFASFISVWAGILILAGCGGQQVETAKENPGAAPAAQPQGAKVVENLSLTLAGGNPGGFWSLIGEGVSSVLRESIPNTQANYEPGAGVPNTINTASGKITMGLAHNFEVKAALTGMEPYKEKVPEVQAIATVYNNAPQQFVITQEFADKYGIQSLEDIAEKKPPIRVAINQRGNMTETINRLSFEANGFTYEDIKSWGGEVYFDSYSQAIPLMKDNKIDLFGVPAFAPDGKILELLGSRKIALLPLNEKAQKLLEEQLGVPTGVIPAGSYEFLKEDVQTSLSSAIIVVDPKMSVDEAYTITKTLVENLERIKALHKNLSVLTPEIMSNVSPAQLHPGAELYYKEAGFK
ncbi:TAXI family TRAP transporter solute-binding subunit [Ammoniphilus sp. YIM 78166]|uniref:TAXI family TRAP transporter solute-binding subunit n=1 Tax=Ammoniphilus sp. YIM 78166 TaxID=1644106 RepID=UPI00142FED41|nr:TAXI family TRAP transporter solute-binding subunit [Ammoniphilus sp. YIM 78166]